MGVQRSNERLGEHFLQLGCVQSSLVFSRTLEWMKIGVRRVSLHLLQLSIGLLLVLLLVSTNRVYFHHFAIYSIILIFTNDIVDTNWLSLSPLIWITIIYLATIATSFTFFLIQFAAKRISASKVMAYTYAVPFWVALGEIIINSSFPDTNIIFGGVIIAFALLMLISDNTTANI